MIIRTPFREPVEKVLLAIVIVVFLLANLWLFTDWWKVKNELAKLKGEKSEATEILNRRVDQKLHGRVLSTSTLYKK